MVSALNELASSAIVLRRSQHTGGAPGHIKMGDQATGVNYCKVVGYQIKTCGRLLQV